MGRLKFGAFVVAASALALAGILSRARVGSEPFVDSTRLATDAAPSVAPADSIHAEFLTIAERVEKGANPFVGRGNLDALEARVAESNIDTAAGREARALVAGEFLRLGGIDRALVILNDAVAALERQPDRIPEEAKLYWHRALANLRDSEIENCVNRHNRDCCIFPLEGGGVHSVSGPARAAKEDFLRYLRATGAQLQMVDGADRERITSERIEARWLLNITCMALNEYPHGVPPRFLIPPSVFESEANIGRFIDVAPRLAIDAFDHAGGAIVDDLDGDGHLDIASSSCAVRGALKAYRNLGDATFEEVAEPWHLSSQLGGLHIAGADYDNDGDLDILVPRGAWMLDDGRIRKSLLRNDGAAGFTDVSRAAGVAAPEAPTQAVVWADFDGDGRLDLFVGNESRLDTNGTSYPSQLYRNRGDGTFEEIAEAAGVQSHRYTKGACAGDYDDDGDLDLYLSNIGPNRLYRNDGGMRFVDVAPELGVTAPYGRSFACWFFDFDNDADLDLWVNAYDAHLVDVALSAMGKPHAASAPCLYRNDGGRFTDIAKEVGLDHAWLPMGSSFGDFDNDGWLDVYLGTGDPSYQALMPNIALRNDRGLRFQDITRSTGLGHLQKGHGVAFADIDDDGDQDIFHQLGGFFPGDAFRNALFVNPGHANRFLKLELVGTESNRQGIGARVAVRVQTPDGPRTLHRAAGCVSSFGQRPRREEIGLGDATSIESIVIVWPGSGTRQTFDGPALDSFVRATEGEPLLQPQPLRPIDFARALDAHEAAAAHRKSQELP